MNELASDVDSFYVDQGVLVSAGAGADQMFRIKNYVGATHVCTLLTNWYTTPDDSSSYVIVPDINGFVERLMDSLRTNPIPVVARDTTTDGDDFAIKPDSTVYQGGGSSLTAAGIALVVDSQLTATKGGGPWTSGSGTGSYQTTIHILSTSDSSSVSGVVVNVKNMSGADQAVPQTTGVSGMVVFFLQDSIVVSMNSSPFYTFTTDTLNKGLSPEKKHTQVENRESDKKYYP